MKSVDKVDVMDLDCDGCEIEVMPKISHTLKEKVSRVIMACHSQPCMDLQSDWNLKTFPKDAWSVRESYGHDSCIKHIHRAEFALAQACPKRIPFYPSLGPIRNGDGTLLIDNQELNKEGSLM